MQIWVNLLVEKMYRVENVDMNTDNVEGSRNKLFISYELAWKKSLPSVLCTVGWVAGRASGL